MDIRPEIKKRRRMNVSEILAGSSIGSDKVSSHSLLAWATAREVSRCRRNRCGETPSGDCEPVRRGQESSLHVAQQVRERLIGELDLNHPFARIVQIEDDIDADRHHECEREPVKAGMARSATADHISCQKGTD